MKWIFVGLINFYQAHLSPRKGFSCAHRRLHGGHSCSQAVKTIIVSRGVLGSLSAIKSRFIECRDAAHVLRNQSYTPLRADLDCGLNNCMGCTDIGGADTCLFGGDLASSPTLTQPIVFFPVGIVGLLIIMACLYWFHGRQIELIEIRLLDGAKETQDKPLAKLLGNQLPDYQIIVEADGETTKTNTLKNSSAIDWLQLKPKGVLYRADINRLTVVNNKILKDQILETFENPAPKGAGKLYEYQIRNKWAIF